MSSRSRALPLTLAALAVLLLYIGLFAHTSAFNIGRSDFTATYVGAILLRTGHGAQIYASALQGPLHAALIAPDHEGNLPFVNPPLAALLAAPVSLLPLVAAFQLWRAGQLLALLTAAVVAMRAAPWGGAGRLRIVASVVVALAAPATLALGLLGQWDGFSALGVALAYRCWRDDRRGLGAAILTVSSLAAKPHLTFGLAAFLLGWRDRRLLVGAVLGAAAVVAASLLVVGPDGLLAFAHADVGDATRWSLPSLLGFNGLLGSWVGDPGVAQAAATCLSVLALGACAAIGARHRHRAPLEPCLAAVMTLSLAASPHLLMHDLSLLVPVVIALDAWRTGRATGSPRLSPSLLLVVLYAAEVLDFGQSAMGPPGRLTPIALSLTAVVIARAWVWPSPHAVDRA